MTDMSLCTYILNVSRRRAACGLIKFQKLYCFICCNIYIYVILNIWKTFQRYGKFYLNIFYETNRSDAYTGCI